MAILPEKRVYTLIPIAKAHLYIKEKVNVARKALDKKYLTWDTNWSDETLQQMKNDPDIILLTHQEALKKMATPEWSSPEKLLDRA